MRCTRKEERRLRESRVDCVRANHFTLLPWLKRNFNSKREGEEKKIDRFGLETIGRGEGKREGRGEKRWLVSGKQIAGSFNICSFLAICSRFFASR